MDTALLSSISRKCKLLFATASTAFLAACGGGVDVAVGGSFGPDPNPGPASVTDSQAFKVSSASIAGGPMSILIPSNVLLAAMDGLRSVNGYQTGTLDISAACTAPGGRLTLSVIDADNTRTFTQGDVVSLSFVNCSASNDGVSLILNGTLETTTAVAFSGGNAIVTQTFTPRNLAATVRGVTATFNGSLSIETVLSPTDQIISQAYVTNLLEVTFSGGRTDRVSNARWGYVDDVAAGVVRLSPNQNVTLFEPSGITTAFSVRTVAPLTFRNSDGLLTSGQLSVLHPSDTLQVTVTSVGQLQIAIDYNSGGLYDRFLNINALDLLNGWN
jgi:hypothetical protein